MLHRVKPAIQLQTSSLLVPYAHVSSDTIRSVSPVKLVLWAVQTVPTVSVATYAIQLLTTSAIMASVFAS